LKIVCHGEKTSFRLDNTFQPLKKILANFPTN
jgi:hypothetical protein